MAERAIAAPLSCIVLYSFLFPKGVAGMRGSGGKGRRRVAHLSMALGGDRGWPGEGTDRKQNCV